MWHVVSPVDSRRLQRAPPAFDRPLLRPGPGLAWWLALRGPGWARARGCETLPSLAGWVVRWIGGLVAIYAFVEALWRTVQSYYALAGFATPVLHDHPTLSRSVRELWGERWARPVSAWLHANVLKPLARRGLPRVGLGAAFLGSAVLHAYAVLACAGWIMALSMLAYFLVQGFLVILERILGVQRWSVPAAHAWVLGVMILTSPLFIEPFLRTVGIAAPHKQSSFGILTPSPSIVYGGSQSTFLPGASLRRAAAALGEGPLAAGRALAASGSAVRAGVASLDVAAGGGGAASVVGRGSDAAGGCTVGLGVGDGACVVGKGSGAACESACQPT